MPQLNDVSMIFTQGKQRKIVFEHLSLDFPMGATTAIMGPSGCGKTTCLRLLAGLISPTLGNVTCETKHISYLFQDTALLPWLTAQENINLVLSDRKKTQGIAKEWLARVGLATEQNAFPRSLSGGMQQRVALARALCTDADLLLLDEPFRGLDAVLHERMLELIRTARQGKTTIFVTHDEKDLRIADFCVTFGTSSERCTAVKSIFLS